jgi:hypothetical protein
MILNIVVSILLYPGLALALVLALLLAFLTERRIPLERLPGAQVVRNPGGLAACASVLLAAIALALLPWPYHPALGWSLVGQPIAFWCALEGAFLLAQLPALLAPAPLAARAAARELQMNAAGRCVFWLAVGCLFWGGAGWSLAVLPGRLLAGLAGLLALPAAIGIGPFGAERSLSAAGAEEGLDEGTAGLVRLARGVRGAASLAALVVASTPLAQEPNVPLTLNANVTRLQPGIVLLLIVALFVVIALLLRQVTLAMPRLTLPAALRWCWWRALPLALAGLIYLAVT